MYNQVSANIDMDGSYFYSFWVEDSQKEHCSRTVNFETDHIHPLLHKAAQIKPGEYQNMLHFLEETLKDPEFYQTVQFSHRDGGDFIWGWGSLYDGEPEDCLVHTNVNHPKILTHKCKVEHLIDFIKKRLERENAPLHHRLQRECSLAARHFKHIRATGSICLTLFVTSLLIPTFLLRSASQVYSSLRFTLKL